MLDIRYFNVMQRAHLRTDCMLALPKPPFAGLPASSLAMAARKPVLGTSRPVEYEC